MLKLFLIVIALLLAFFLIYSWIDARITLDYYGQELKYRAEHIKLQQKLLFELGVNKSKAELLQLAEKLQNEGHIVKSENTDEIGIDGVILHFHGDSLVKVGSLNEY